MEPANTVWKHSPHVLEEPSEFEAMQWWLGKVSFPVKRDTPTRVSAEEMSLVLSRKRFAPPHVVNLNRLRILSIDGDERRSDDREDSEDDDSEDDEEKDDDGDECKEKTKGKGESEEEIEAPPRKRDRACQTPTRKYRERCPCCRLPIPDNWLEQLVNEEEEEEWLSALE